MFSLWWIIDVYLLLHFLLNTNFNCIFVLDQHSKLQKVYIFYSGSSLKQQSTDRHVAPLGHIIPIPIQPVFALSL